MAILFCVFIKELGKTVKNYTMTIILKRWPKKLISVATTLKSVQFFCLVKFLGQHKLWKLFPANIDRNVLSHIGMVRPFCGFPMRDCYRDHGLLRSTQGFDNSVSFMHSRCLKDFVTFLYRDLNSTSEFP